jgi:hypothetical protein
MSVPVLFLELERAQFSITLKYVSGSRGLQFGSDFQLLHDTSGAAALVAPDEDQLLVVSGQTQDLSRLYQFVREVRMANARLKVIRISPNENEDHGSWDEVLESSQYPELIGEATAFVKQIEKRTAKGA